MEVTVTKDVQAPQERVFDIYPDLTRAEGRISGITKLELLSDGPVGLGTRWRETRIMFGKEATEEMEITAFDLPRSYRVEAESHGTHYVTDFTFTPQADNTATRVDMRFVGIPQSFMAKIMGRLMGGMMKKTVIKCRDDDMEELKQVAERADT